MTFEDALASLGKELGLPLEIENGKAGFEASFGDDGEEPVSVEISADGDDDFVVVSADLGELPSDDIESLATRMLAANHPPRAPRAPGCVLSRRGRKCYLSFYRFSNIF